LTADELCFFFGVDLVAVDMGFARLRDSIEGVLLVSGLARPPAGTAIGRARARPRHGAAFYATTGPAPSRRAASAYARSICAGTWGHELAGRQHCQTVQLGPATGPQSANLALRENLPQARRRHALHGKRSGIGQAGGDRAARKANRQVNRSNRPDPRRPSWARSVDPRSRHRRAHSTCASTPARRRPTTSAPGSAPTS